MERELGGEGARPMGPGEYEGKREGQGEMWKLERREAEMGEEGDACRTREGGVEEGTRRRVIEL